MDTASSGGRKKKSHIKTKVLADLQIHPAINNHWVSPPGQRS